MRGSDFFNNIDPKRTFLPRIDPNQRQFPHFRRSCVVRVFLARREGGIDALQAKREPKPDYAWAI